MLKKYAKFVENQLINTNIEIDSFRKFQLVDGKILLSLLKSEEFQDNQLQEIIQQFLDHLTELRALSDTFQYFTLNNSHKKRKREQINNNYFISNNQPIDSVTFLDNYQRIRQYSLFQSKIEIFQSVYSLKDMVDNTLKKIETSIKKPSSLIESDENKYLVIPLLSNSPSLSCNNNIHPTNSINSNENININTNISQIDLKRYILLKEYLLKLLATLLEIIEVISLIQRNLSPPHLKSDQQNSLQF